MARKGTFPVPEVGGEAPEFQLSSAQGGQLRLSMRTADGPVIVVFHEGPTGEEVAYFKDLASKEDEINLAGGSVVGIGVSEPGEARDFVRQTGIRSYVLYDYARIATREYGLLEEDRTHGDHARPATFIVGGDHKVAHAWVGERPTAAEVLAKVSEITGLPKQPDEEDKEKPNKGEVGEDTNKSPAEERETSSGGKAGSDSGDEPGGEAAKGGE